MKKTWNDAQLEELEIAMTAGGPKENTITDGPYNSEENYWPAGERFS